MIFCCLTKVLFTCLFGFVIRFGSKQGKLSLDVTFHVTDQIIPELIIIQCKLDWSLEPFKPVADVICPAFKCNPINRIKLLKRIGQLNLTTHSCSVSSILSKISGVRTYLPIIARLDGALSLGGYSTNSLIL